MANIIGYARVSTTDQNPDLQLDALKAAGAVRVFTDKASGSSMERPQLQKCLRYLNPGDVLVVWRIDRLGRSLIDLVSVVSDLAERKIQFRSLTEAIDTTTPGGELVFHIFAALAQMEKRLISERTKAGLAAAKERGRVGGRPTVMTPERIKAAQDMKKDGTSTSQIARTLGVGRATVDRALA